jgi:hypothetical protein
MRSQLYAILINHIPIQEISKVLDEIMAAFDNMAIK